LPAQNSRQLKNRVSRFTLSKDPIFIDALREIVELYMNPPELALVFAALDAGTGKVIG